LNLSDRTPPIVLVPIEGWDRLSRKAVHCAIRLSDDVTALHVIDVKGLRNEDEEKRLRAEWQKCVTEPAQQVGLRPPRLQFVQSPYRSVLAPLLRAIEHEQARVPGRRVFVVLPELIEGRWWGILLHTHRERRLRARLLRYGGPHVAVICEPWQIEVGRPEQGIEEEEPAAA
jgi:hypothetical protein